MSRLVTLLGLRILTVGLAGLLPIRGALIGLAIAGGLLVGGQLGSVRILSASGG